ncbi:hypothetical protein LT493_31280 [Streptomyces tricolor]|nr:hypothetical protein [Streptomyces tricolor]
MTRGALQQATGLSRATVGQRLDRLFRAGWLREGAGGPVDSPLGGRPSITLEFDDSHAVVLAADLDTRHARAAVLSLTGRSSPTRGHAGGGGRTGRRAGRTGALVRRVADQGGAHGRGGVRDRARGAGPGGR